MENNFRIGNPVPSDVFFNRRREKRLLTSRILTDQSTAIEGDPRIGKTSLLLYIMDQSNRDSLYGEAGERIYFKYIDVQKSKLDSTDEDFWEEILFDYIKKIMGIDPYSKTIQCYEDCKYHHFNVNLLEHLLTLMELEKWRLVLIIDEFDYLFQLKTINYPQFFGALRSLTTRRSKAITLIISTRQTIGEFNNRMKDINSGSPFLNHLFEITLGPFSEEETEIFLSETCGLFRTSERRYLYQLSGGHPFLLQAAGQALLESYQNGMRMNLRLQYTSKALQNLAYETLNDTWRVWSPLMKMVFTTVALCDSPRLLGNKKFKVSALARSLPDYQAELHHLEKRGFIRNCGNIEDWKLNGDVMGWWLYDSLNAALRDKDELGKWMLNQQLEGLFTKSQKDQIVRVVKSISPIIVEGAFEALSSIAQRNYLS